jgi:anti-anti-sigma regulatory factor
VTTTIKIPIKFDLSATRGFVRGIVGASGTPNDKSFLFDFSKINFIDGSGYTVLSNTLGWLLSQGCEIYFINHQDTKRTVISYLDDCGFFYNYTGKSLRYEACARGSTIPCTTIKHASAFGWLENTFSPWISYELNVSHGALTSIRTCIKELFNNINDHSMQDTGFVHVQHYPNLKKIGITVSDFGTGIPNTIRKRFGHMSDGAAILLASQDGVTAKTHPNNMGKGLAYLIDRVTSNHGRVDIVSSTGSLNCFRDKSDTLRREPSLGNGTYPGTLVDIALDTRFFVGDEEELVEVDW